MRSKSSSSNYLKLASRKANKGRNRQRTSLSPTRSNNLSLSNPSTQKQSLNSPPKGINLKVKSWIKLKGKHKGKAKVRMLKVIKINQSNLNRIFD